MPDDVQRFLIENMSLDKLNAMAVRYANNRDFTETGIDQLTFEEISRRQKSQLALGMMSHRRLNEAANPWLREVVGNRDALSVIASHL